MLLDSNRKFSIGAEYSAETGTNFRVWAPKRKKVEVVVEPGQTNSSDRKTVELRPEDHGFFSATLSEAGPGDLYWFKLDGEDNLYADPASRFQPEGPHGPSEIIDPQAYNWRDGEWKGLKIRGQVIYEMHVGTFTSQGDYRSAAGQIPELADLGITTIELMPLAEFAGKFGWGYDGVDLYAPTRLYGRPEDLKYFVDEAHKHGLAVILDVVYNHLGPDGNYLREFSDDYFTDKHKTHWGEAINFDGPNNQFVREFFIENARYWIDEFHMDGLRVDATPEMKDSSDKHILAEISNAVRNAAGERSVIVIGENEPQDVTLVTAPDRGGYGFDSLWNDDFHHSAIALLSGRNQAYYSDYLGTPQEFVSSIKWGFLYQGQRYKWQKQRRGTPTFGFDPTIFVHFIQNHDQVANSAKGLRIHQLTGPGRFRTMTALLLLSPATPMLFQGQEYGASQPFLYFADHKPELSKLVHSGRIKFLRQFNSLRTVEGMSLVSPPHEPETFEQCVLNFAERKTNHEIYDLHKDLIKLRKQHQAFRNQKYRGVDGAVIGPQALVLRFFDEHNGMDTLLIANFGLDYNFNPAPEPLLAPLRSMRWRLLWSSEDPKYGGSGTPPLDTPENWWIPGHAAVVLIPKPDKEA